MPRLSPEGYEAEIRDLQQKLWRARYSKTEVARAAVEAMLRVIRRAIARSDGQYITAVAIDADPMRWVDEAMTECRSALPDRDGRPKTADVTQTPHGLRFNYETNREPAGNTGCIHAWRSTSAGYYCTLCDARRPPAL